MRHLWLVVLVLGVGCAGSVPRRLHFDAGTTPSVSTPINSTLEADGGAAPRPDSRLAPKPDSQPAPKPDSKPALKPDSQPATPPPPPPATCTAVDGACGSGAPACCAGSFCVNFTGIGVKCGKICTAASQCPQGCCVGTSGGTSVCAPASFCPAQPPTNPTPPSPGPGSLSCKGMCGGEAPGGCFCDYECVLWGDCCSDVYLCLF